MRPLFATRVLSRQRMLMLWTLNLPRSGRRISCQPAECRLSTPCGTAIVVSGTSQAPLVSNAYNAMRLRTKGTEKVY
jgi:hypothetical protein